MEQMENLLRKIFVNKFPPLSQASINSLSHVFPWILLGFGIMEILTWVVEYVQVFSLVIGLLAAAGGLIMVKKIHFGWRLAIFCVLLSIIKHIAYLSFIGMILDIIFLYSLMQIEQQIKT